LFVRPSEIPMPCQKIALHVLAESCKAGLTVRWIDNV
jgi:hypothetical protein